MSIRFLRYSLISIALSATTVALWGAGIKFYSDDPLAREPETRDASNAKRWTIDLTWDLAYNLFAKPGASVHSVRAGNVNTIDEVPDSNWFNNRILARPVSIEEVVNWPLPGTGPAPPPWTLIGTKDAGAAPGFTMRDSQGGVWFVSFDGKGQPEAATSAIIIANKIFWALGYWQVENHLISIHSEDIVISETARIRLPNGERVPVRRSDLDDVFRRSERSGDGSYRAVAGRGLPGTILGGFRYVGTRPDDPNDVVPHEDRRELRALKVFGAWTNLVDMKAGNTLDTLIQDGARKVVRHYLQDVGSTFGTGANAPREYDEGWEYLFEGRPMLARMLTLGLYVRPWQTADYKEFPSIGRFEAKAFDPIQWKPRVPTGAFLRAQPDDNFWAARRVMAFNDEMIRAIVRTGRFSDSAAEKYLADTLIGRRDKIGQAYLNAVNPLVSFALDTSGVLTFQNAAAAARIAAAPASGYSSEWAIFNNATGETQSLGARTTALAERIPAPAGLPSQDGSYIRIQVAATGSATASAPISVYFRRAGGVWQLAGLER